MVSRNTERRRDEIQGTWGRGRVVKCILGVVRSVIGVCKLARTIPTLFARGVGSGRRV